MTQVLVESCVFSENVNTITGGGAMVVFNFADVQNCNFTRNVARRAGGAASSAGVLQILGCMLAENAADAVDVR